MHGIFDFKNNIQLKSDKNEQIVINAPRPIIILLHGIDAIDIPILPNTVDRVLIKAATEPVSLLCWFNSKLVLKGLVIVLDKDIIRKEIQNKTGASVPMDITRIPLMQETIMMIAAKCFLLIPEKKRIYKKGPKVESNAFAAK